MPATMEAAISEPRLPLLYENVMPEDFEALFDEVESKIKAEWRFVRPGKKSEFSRRKK